MKRTKSRQGLNSQSIEVPELSIQDLDGDIRRSNTMPPKLKNDGLTIRVLESGSKSLSLRRRNTTKVEYPTSAYFQGDSDNKPRVQTPGFTNVSLTAVNVLVTPDGNGSSHLSSPQTPAFENITANNKVITLVKPNLMRAFTRKALSYQKRQRFQNLCCVLFCPFSIVMVSLILKVLVSQLTADDVTTNFDVLYCSNKRSVNEQNWPIYNISSPVIARLNASEVPGATRDVRAVNYLSRLSLVDVSGRDPITQLASASLASSVSCSQWFGEQYPTGPQKIYEPDIKPIHPYSTKDSLYTSEIRSGWLDVLEPTNDGRDLENVYAKQALSLLRTFITYQTRPWAIVGASNDGDKQKIGSAPQEPSFKDANRIPGGVGIFPKGGSGILNTIESRYYAKGTAIPPKLNGYQKVPFFLTNFSSPEIMNDYLIEAIRTTIKSIGKLQPTSPELGKISADVAVADAFFRLQEAVNDMPYGAIFFEQIDHALKQYSYIMQFGGNKVLDEVIAFPNKGLRRLIQQSQLTNGILRNSATTLASTVITQGTRAFPKMEPSQFSIPFGSTIGRILYPLGISFLLPISALEVVRDKESKIVLMLRMNGLGNITAYYLSLYVQFFINYLLSSAVFLITGYIANLELYRNTDWLILIVLFLLWGHIQSTLAFMFASFFKSSTSATVVVFLVVIGGVVTSFLLDQVFDDPSSFPLGLMIWPPFVFYRALGILNINATSTRKPAYTLSKLRPGDPIFFSFLVLAAEGILIVLVAIYTTQVIPSGVGRPKPWYYPFRDIWAYFKKDKVVPTESSLDIAENNPNEDVEEADVHAERIKIRKGRYSDDTPLVVHNLSKTYDASSKVPKEAVRNISFEVGNGVVFGLLGPNGAGKTSLISMLTGVTQPDHGTAKIAGLDIADNPEYAFRSIGVCPQFDILWEDLTIEDHLYFYARLKGVAIAFESDAVTAALQLVELSALRTRTVKQLSGGEKRRVSIAISLVSDPKVILFDEPTTGLDPEVRRSVWDTIARARANRAILMTTHSMEEADICCQKIGIMAKGTLRCLGSPSRLKELYGCGYKLKITFSNLQIAERFVISILPAGTKLLHNYQTMRIYSFTPDSSALADIFDHLVHNATGNAILSWGINQTTLDEIFTSVISEADASS